MRKLKKTCLMLMCLLPLMQKTWAMWDEKEEKQENTFSGRAIISQYIEQEEINRELYDQSKESAPQEDKVVLAFPQKTLDKEKKSHFTKIIIYSNENTHKKNNKLVVQANHTWETVSDFLTSGGTWSFAWRDVQSSQPHFLPVVNKLKIEIFKVQRNKNHTRALKNEIENLKLFYSLSDFYKISKFIYNKSFNVQLLDHKLGEKIYALSEINSALHHSFVSFSERDLVILDVDETLIWFLDPFYSEHALKNSPLHQRCLESENNVYYKFFYWFMTSAPCALIEPQTPDLVSNLQNKGIKTLALTALRPLLIQDESEVINTPKFRVNHLKELGFDFSKSFPMPPFGWAFDANSNKDFPEPYFEKGILFSGVEEKYNALFNYLRAISFRPKNILFVDDNIDNVVSLNRELTRMGVNCYSVLYTRTKKYSIRDIFSKNEFDLYLKEQEDFVTKRLE